MKNILILGVNGFIGHHLSKRILGTTDWRVFGMDMHSDRIAPLLDNPRLHFFEGDITINREWIEYHVKKCDVVLPLVAIATPATYVREPLRVFELDFEANLPIVRLCVKHGKRVLFPSTSEVYGMCHDAEFDPYASELVYGPIDKPRWIYACSKQLMDRVIHAYGMREELDYTLFRPFNWIGSGTRQHARGEGRQLARDHAVPRPHRARREHPPGRRRPPEALLHRHQRRHRRADEDHREPGRPRQPQDLQHRQPDQQPLGARAGQRDAAARRRLPRIPRQRRQGASWSRSARPSTTARATRTSRTACRRSTTRAPNSTGRRA